MSATGRTAFWRLCALSLGALSLGALALCALALCALAAPALAQGARHPFAIGVNEGAASATGISGWILAQESGFYRLLSGAVRAIREGASNGATLAALSFAYGVFHAAGPGHGKAVIAAYMVADERQLRRGLAISAAAAALQGVVAVALVAAAFLILGASARQMTQAARWIEIASFFGVAALGAALTFAKGRALLALWRPAPLDALAAFGPLRLAGAAASGFIAQEGAAQEGAAQEGASQQGPAHAHGPGCGHAHGFDPGVLGEEVSWRRALLTVGAAGSRPCSGAILVLVFASAQGVFWAGVGAVAAMSAGVALATGALASAAVFAKAGVERLNGAGSARALLAGRLFEFAAAFAVLVFGLALLAAALGAERLAG